MAHRISHRMSVRICGNPHRSDRRLGQLGGRPNYRVEANPLPWLELNGAEHTNLFENRSTEYSRAATQGIWDEVWAELDGG